MTRLLDLQTEFAREGWTDEWLVVDAEARPHGPYVSIGREYISPSDGERRSWQDSGICVDAEHLEQLIDALVRARSQFTSAAKETK